MQLIAAVESEHGGYSPVPQRAKVWNRTGGATVAGKCYKLDLDGTAQSETTSILPNVDGSGWSNIIAVASASDNETGIYVLALEAVADNKELKSFGFGIVSGLPVAGGGSATRGAAIYTDADGDLTVTAPTGGVDGRKVGKLLTVSATPTIFFFGAIPTALAITT